jgi:hypothetical protein
MLDLLVVAAMLSIAKAERRIEESWRPSNRRFWQEGLTGSNRSSDRPCGFAVIGGTTFDESEQGVVGKG